VLSQNNITPSQFGKAMRNLLVEGRGKHRNIMIVGPTGCGKTFLSKPLNLFFKAFCNPGNDKYAFMNAVESEVIVLNVTFQHHKIISAMFVWKRTRQFLRQARVPSPIKASATAEMMAWQPWNVFKFTKQIPKEDQKEISPYARCFALLVLR